MRITAEAIAKLNINNFPQDRQGIEYLAKKGGWKFSFEQLGRGRPKKMYDTASMPTPIRDAIYQKQAELALAEAKAVEAGEAVPVQRRQTEVMAADVLAQSVKELNGRQREVAHARCAVCMEILYRCRVFCMKKNHAMQSFLSDLEMGKLPETLIEQLKKANDRSNKATVGIRSLKSWIALYEKAATPMERLVLLSPKATKTSKSPLELEWLGHFQRFFSLPTKPKMTHAYEEFSKWWRLNRGDAGLPSYAVVRNAWKKLPPIVQERGRSSGSELKKVAAFVRRDWVSNLKPLDVWIIDGHSFKAHVRHPIHGQPFKPEVTLILDGNSRLVMGFSLGLAESSMEVMNAVRHAVADFGVPLVIYSDNGAGETAKRLDDEFTGIFTRLGIRHETGIAGNPQGRGIIERWWKDNLIRLAREYPTFRGEQMDSGVKNLTYRKQASAFLALEKGKELTTEQKKYVQQVPTWEQFKADVQAVIERYNHRPHRELPKDGVTGKHFTPFDFFTHQAKKHELSFEKLTSMELETLFMPMEVRITRRGWIDFHNASYFSQELVDFHGQSVHVAYDMADASYLMVYDSTQTLICKAILNGNTRDAFAPSMIEREMKKRADRKIKKAQQQIALAKAEVNPALEHAQTWDALNLKSDVLEADFVVLPSERKKPADDFVLFEADL